MWCNMAMAKRTSRAWLRAVAVVLFALILAAVAAVVSQQEASRAAERAFAVRLQESSRTRFGAYVNRGSANDEAASMLQLVEPLESLRPNGVTFVVIPSCSDMKFAFSLANRPGSNMVFVAKRSLPGNGQTVERKSIAIPSHVKSSLIAEFDKLSPPWAGDPEITFDGTQITIQRVKEFRTFSGSDATSGYDLLAEKVRHQLAAYVPVVNGLDTGWLEQGDGC